jgi:LPXTG-motif cell wall-anchored protein
MSNETLIRVIAGILFVVVLFIIIWRRKRNASSE